MGYPQQNPDGVESLVVGGADRKGDPVLVIPGNEKRNVYAGESI
jgi:hypothetical protein